MHIRQIIFSDFDYTMYPHGHPDIIEKNLAAIQKWREDGNFFAIATGRSLSSIKRDFQDYAKYTDFLVTEDGATIYDNSGNIIHRDSMSNGDISLLNKMLRESQLSGEFAMIFYRNGVEYKDVHTPCSKIRIWFSNENDCKNIAKRVNKEHPNFRALAYTKNETNFDAPFLNWINADKMHYVVEINIKKTTKKSAIDQILKGNCNNYTDVITIGDDYNDIEMIRAYNGYAIRSPISTIMEIVRPDHIIDSLSSLITMKTLA